MSMKQAISESTTKRTRRTFSDEFKVRAVKMVTEQGYKVAEAARNLDINPNLLGRWKLQLSASDQKDNSTGNEELKSLREEVKRLRMERDILKKATAFFASEKD